MIVTTTTTAVDPYNPYGNPHPRTCTCPNCGYVHASGAWDGTIVFVHGAAMYSDTIGGDAVEQLRLSMLAEHYAAVGRSRELARLPDHPPRRPSMHEPARACELMVHVQRCPARRPKLSLRKRVVSSLACRRRSR